ncbi:MAG TPA: alpha/beta hydrolase [Patescibacteria group bacterium]|nr:alpha/beta hydrolase [Patescibacteria group bacterium]
MVTFVLPGYSLHNKKWAEECAAELKLDHEIRPVFWNHWDDPSHVFDPKEKVRLIVDTARENQINILAKSVGTLIASHIIEKVPDRIQKVVLCGIPINDLNEDDKEVYRRVFRNFPAEKVVCYQNTDDPHGTITQIKEFLAKINQDIKVIEKDRADHEYPYYKDFGEFLRIS